MLRPDTADIREASKLSNMFRDRYRIDFGPAIGQVLSIKTWDETARKRDLIASKRDTGYHGEVLYRLSGAVVKCHCVVSDEVLYIDVDTFLFPAASIESLSQPGPAPRGPAIPEQNTLLCKNIE